MTLRTPDVIIDAMNLKDIVASDSVSKKRTITYQKVQDVREDQYDIFICHASEDKEPFVRSLAIGLKKFGLNVWYDEFALSIGDSLRHSIDRGLSQSTYGVVVLSHNFFSKEWPQRELDGLVAKELGEKKVILPVWHGISRNDVQRYSPLLADRMAVSSENGVGFVINEIVRVVRK